MDSYGRNQSIPEITLIVAGEFWKLNLATNNIKLELPF